MAASPPSAPRYDLFISYSRMDHPFVRRLADALDGQKRRAWVDWQGIPPSADWMREVYAAIEGADAFVFILSAASLKSAVCADEVARAVACRKRLIPIALGPIDDSAVPVDVRRVNWVVCREPQDFDAAVTSLVQALDTDLEWVRDHTRLLVRAVEWKNAGQEASRLLRGADLQRAEAWLAQAVDRDPRPAELHSSFVLASRVEQTRRSRRTLVAVAAALVVAIGLAVTAWFQRAAAVAQTAIAEEQRDLAEANRLDAERQSIVALTNESVASLKQGLELEALLAALRAAARLQRETTFQQPSVPFYRTVVALRQAVFDTHEVNRFATNEFRGVTHLAFTADDSGIYAAGGGGAIKQWTPAGRFVSAFETEHSGEGDGCTSIANMALAKDGRTLVTLGNEGMFALWTPAGVKTGGFDAGARGSGNCSAIVSSTIDAKGELITIRDWRSTFVRSFTGAAVESQPATEPEDSDFQAASRAPVVSSGNRFEARGTPDGSVVVTRRAGDVELMRLRNQQSPAFSHDERTLATVSSAVDSSVIHIWDIEAAEPIAPADEARPSSPRTLSLGGRSVTVQAASSTDVRAAVLSPAGDSVAVISNVRMGQVELWRLSGSAPPVRGASIVTDQLASADFSIAVVSLAFSPDSHVLATGGSDGTVKLWDQQGTLTRRVVAHRQDASAVFSPDGLLLLTWSDSADGIEIKLWTTDGELLDTMRGPDWTGIRFSGDGRWIIGTTPSPTRGAAPQVHVWPLAVDVLMTAGCRRLQTYFGNPATRVEPELCAQTKR